METSDVYPPQYLFGYIPALA